MISPLDIRAVGSLEHVKPDAFQDHGLRSDSYWKMPTFLGRRYIDLKFLKDQTEKNPLFFKRKRSKSKPDTGKHLADSEKFLPAHLAELYVLENIIQKAGEKLGAPKPRSSQRE